MSGEFSDIRWYAVATRSRFEKKLDVELRKRGVESFLPVIEEIHFWSDRRKKVQEPLFRGYLFVRMDFRERLKVLQTDGAVRIVSVGPKPSPIPDEQINWVKILAGHPDAIRRAEYVAVGDSVRIIAGPFRGVEGIVTRTGETLRVVVGLASIAQAVSVDVDPAFVELVVHHTDADAEGISEGRILRRMSAKA